ncbi:unnamed protein product [Vicia faba]|uniref:Reverse transcriptase domain-containing protein n=2 Tax=Vicia faba TaxID=3906 RepID=A0AAV0Z7K0_VICFA|nr:unnamed protein product [Vicia faba]
MYKVLSKLLASRLKKVLHVLVSDCQNAFIPGRHLLDGVLIANEPGDYATKDSKSCFLFKVVFEKAYNKVSWSFLKYVLRRMGFVIKALTRLVRRSVDEGDFTGFNIKGVCMVDILQFAEGTLMVGDGIWKHVWALKTVIRGFELIFGFGVNYHKSKIIGINLNSNFLNAAAHFLSCKVEENEFSFLGIPIGSNPRRISFWKPLISSIRNHLSGWKSRFLSLGERDFMVEYSEGQIWLSAGPSLYCLSSLKNSSVVDLGVWEEDCWYWGNLGILVEEGSEEAVLLNSLRNLLASVAPDIAKADPIQWNPNSVNGFTVSSCYGSLNGQEVSQIDDGEKVEALEKI